MKRLLIALIRFYKTKISPKKKAVCRFRPTCSSYALEAIERHGALAGSIMTFCRIMRCNPLFRGGYDPVPERFTLRSGVGRYKEPSVCEKCEKRNICDRTKCI
ncbi:MAG: membrane protein insertion efficiency factor YidD [Oscillospiraceae bacterium]|nr:membrane protein insertion efficiency factor YidD [Oscillospiraceae bacterium]